MKTIIEPLYGRSQVASPGKIHAHRLSVFFAVLACGAYYDRTLHSDTLAKQYHVLARAALALETIIRETNTATAQALLTIIGFMRVSDFQSHQERWLLGGTLTRLAQIVNFYCSIWLRSDCEVDRLDCVIIHKNSGPLLS